MGFIDQIMGAMGMEAAQTVTEEPTSNADPQRTEETKTDEVKEKAEKIQDLDDGTDQGEGASSEEKTYSRDELNDILNEKRKEWEEERLANLSKDEQISQLKKELFKANMKDQINNRLTEEGIPVKAAELISIQMKPVHLKAWKRSFPPLRNWYPMESRKDFVERPRKGLENQLLPGSGENRKMILKLHLSKQ